MEFKVTTKRPYPILYILCVDIYAVCPLMWCRKMDEADKMMEDYD
jgi:hypothetical protein